jgi:hypothetical protein
LSKKKKKEESMSNACRDSKRLVALFALAFISGAALAADFSSWGRTATIRFAGYNRPETLTNFPALVVLGTNIVSGFAYADFLSAPNGDLRFADATQTNELEYEIEKWDTNGTSFVWVRVPFLVDSNTTIRAYWMKGGTNAPAYATSGVAWTNGYVSVWHLAETTGTKEYDSTPQTNHGVVASGVTLNTNGVVDGGDYLDGSANGYSDCGANASLNVGTNSSWEAWVYPTSLGAYNAVVAKGYNQSWWFGLASGTIQLWAGGSANQSAPKVPSNQWTHIAATWDGITIRYYTNGIYCDSDPKSGAAAKGSMNTHIGADYTSGNGGVMAYQFAGRLDEIRVSGVTRSSNWIWAAYMNAYTNGAFAGSFNAYGAGGPRIANGTVTNILATSADMGGTLVSTDSAPTTVYCFWATNDGLASAAAWLATGAATNMQERLQGATFTNPVSGLLTNTLYYYNFMASNSIGMAWGSTTGSPSFRTLGPPDVDNGAGVSLKLDTSARINGNLRVAGTAHCYFYWGTNSTNPETTIDLGDQSQGPLFSDLSNLTPNSTYYYRIYAINSYGESLSPVTNFTTLSEATCTWKGATTGDWFSAANWIEGNAPLPGMAVIVTNAGASILLTNSTPKLASLLVAGAPGVTNALVFSNWNTTVSAVTVTLGSNGYLRLPPAFADGQMSNNIYLVCTNLVIESGGCIDANARGFKGGVGALGGNGPGKGPTNATGAAHGGYGGLNQNDGTMGGAPYDATNAPVQPGSGGGGFTVGWTGGAGGGAIRIEAGIVTNNGLISADGEDSTHAYAGGGSGGSVWIACRAIAGSGGLVTAKGGTAGGTANWAGGGGGGRIAVTFDPASQGAASKPAIVFNAARGTNSYPFTNTFGTPGTIYFTDATILDGAVFPHTGRIYLGSKSWAPSRLTVSNVWVAFPDEGFALAVSNDVWVMGASGRLDLGGEWHWRQPNSGFAHFFYSAATSTPTLNVGGQLVVTNGGSLYVNSGITNGFTTNYSALVSVTGDITVASSGSIVVRSNPTNGGSAIFRAQNLIVRSNGVINASGAGFCGGGGSVPACGPGRPTGGTDGGGAGGGWGAGAGYGGRGGANANGYYGPTYGSSNTPIDPGSGGRGYAWYAGFGGGLVRVEARDTIRIDGTINAKGGYGRGSWSGAGSGGGIYLRCINFQGSSNGLLLAAGGDGDGSAAACSFGGGGRIAIWRQRDSFQGTVSATNGTATGFAATGMETGTVVYVNMPAPNRGTIIAIW